MNIKCFKCHEVFEVKEGTEVAECPFCQTKLKIKADQKIDEKNIFTNYQPRPIKRRIPEWNNNRVAITVYSVFIIIALIFCIVLAIISLVNLQTDAFITFIIYILALVIELTILHYISANTERIDFLTKSYIMEMQDDIRRLEIKNKELEEKINKLLAEKNQQ